MVAHLDRLLVCKDRTIKDYQVRFLAVPLRQLNNGLNMMRLPPVGFANAIAPHHSKYQLQ